MGDANSALPVGCYQTYHLT